MWRLVLTLPAQLPRAFGVIRSDLKDSYALRGDQVDSTISSCT